VGLSAPLGAYFFVVKAGYPIREAVYFTLPRDPRLLGATDGSALV
jgi:hypothetical protein